MFYAVQTTILSLYFWYEADGHKLMQQLSQVHHTEEQTPPAPLPLWEMGSRLGEHLFPTVTPAGDRRPLNISQELKSDTNFSEIWSPSCHGVWWHLVARHYTDTTPQKRRQACQRSHQFCQHLNRPGTQKTSSCTALRSIKRILILSTVIVYVFITELGFHTHTIFMCANIRIILYIMTVFWTPK